MPYKILIDKTGSPKLVEVPEPEKKLWFRSEATPADNIAALKKMNSEALSAALSDKSKHITFRGDQDILYFIATTYRTTPSLGQTFDLPPNIGVSFEMTCIHRGNRDSCANETCWDLNVCQRSPELKLAILTPITMKEEPIDCNTASNEEARRDFSSIVKHIDAPVKSEGEEIFLKTPLQLGSMQKEDLINYIDKLHSAIKGYQIVIDTAVARNLNVK